MYMIDYIICYIYLFSQSLLIALCAIFSVALLYDKLLAIADSMVGDEDKLEDGDARDRRRILR